MHEAGGLVVVQDLESAQFDGMPRTAHDTGVADWVVAPQQMPAILESHQKRIDALRRQKDDIDATIGELETFITSLDNQADHGSTT